MPLNAHSDKPCSVHTNHVDTELMMIMIEFVI